MLSKLILINSCTYDLAELDFTDGDSMQLVGGNNVGKSSLIYALNFLFLVNRKLMSFSGGRQADKNTLAYYFKDPERSFIVFEIKKKGRRYCMVVYRDGNGDARYARIAHAYERELFFTQVGDELQLMTWTKVKKNLVLRDIKIKTFQQQQDVLAQVYRTGRNNDAVVWLSKDSKIVGASNSFSKVYRYLINSKSITTDTLRDILLIADNRDRESLSYQQSNMQHVEQLRKESDRLQRLSEIKTDFERFQTLYDLVQQQEAQLSFQAATFRYLATRQRAILKEQICKKEEEAAQLQEQRKADAVELAQLQQSKGEVNLLHRQTTERITSREQERKRLLALPDRALLLQSIANLDQELGQLQFRLRSYDAPGQQDVFRMQANCDRLAREIEQKEKQLENIDNWLIFHLASAEKDRRRLHALLSDQVTRLPKEALEKSIKKTDELVKLFDGSFQLPDDFKTTDLPSPELLADELKEVRIDHQRRRELLETAQNYAAFAEKLKSTQAELSRHQNELREVDQLPALEQEIKTDQRELRSINGKREEITQAVAEQEETLRRKDTGLEVLREKIGQWQKEEQQLSTAHHKLNEMALPEGEVQLDKLKDSSPRAANDLFRTIESEERRWRANAGDKNRLFEQLRSKSQLDLADQGLFIEQLAGEYAAFDDKSSGINTILHNIAVQFANPAGRFLENYQAFANFIERSFNRSMREIHISNIESLRVELAPNHVLQQELEQISNLQLQMGGLFQQNNKSDKGLETLRRFLEQGKEIQFSDLFSLRLRLTVGGEEKTVDLAKQVESDGTDRMLRLVIVMQVISRLSELSEDNKVVLFIDEIATIDGKNRPQLVNFCREHHFYPIFAAPNPVEGFDRYVFISRDKAGRLIVDERKHYMDAARN